MRKVDTDSLTPVKTYYRIEKGSDAEKIFDAFILKSRNALNAMREAAEVIKPVDAAEPIRRGESVFAFAIPEELPIPDGYRKAKKNSREDSRFNGLVMIYPNLKTGKGKEIAKAIKKIPETPETTELVEAFGFGYHGFLIIGNRLFRSLGFFRHTNGNPYVEASVFLDPSGKFYHASSDSLVDKLPLADGLVEITTSEFFAEKGKADE